MSGSQLRVGISDSTTVAECRRAAQRAAERHDFEATTVRRVGLVATELATNILRHARAGYVLIQVLEDGIEPEVELLALDEGEGMTDVDRCMQDGYSTAGTQGTGLGAVSRQSSSFDIYSIRGKGTAVLSRIADKPRPLRPAFRSARALQIGAVCLPVEGEIECGDTWRAAHAGDVLSMFVADGLGHGPLAAAASNAAAGEYVMSPFDQPSNAMARFHRALSGTRGAAAGCALVRLGDSEIDYAGVGNICASVVTHGRARGMVSHNGTLGLQALRPQQFKYPCPGGSTVVMHSDGLSGRWNLAAYPGLGQHHPALIAGILYRDFRRQRDDATVLVARHQQ